MAWQKINSVLRYGTTDSACEGFWKGSGHEDGFYCFQKSPWVPSYDGPFISDSFEPTLTIDGTDYTLQNNTYAGEYVWGGGGYFVFYSTTQRAWIRMNNLREPYYYTDIDETTKVGDKFFEGGLPSLNGQSETWKIDGAYTNSEAGSTVQVTLHQDLWLWNTNGDWRKSKSYFAGKYYNEKDSTWKFLGVPNYKASVSNRNGYMYGETFTRSMEKVGKSIWSKHWTYQGSLGHSINYGSKKWVVGTEGSGAWSESEQEPSLHSDVIFRGYKMVEQEGELVKEEDPLGDFTISFAHLESGTLTKNILMGEFSIWRP